MSETAAPVAFDVVSAFEPLARLERRSPTLDGAVPLRVAQACAPLLEGNEAGFQVVFGRRLVARKRLGKRFLEASSALEDAVRAHLAAAPLLAAQGLLGAAWKERLVRSPWWTERGVLRIWTGLLVRPRSGTWLRVSATKNRATFGLRLRTTWIAGEDAHAFTPLVLDVEDYEDGTRLDGEVATVLPARPGLELVRAGDDDTRALAEAHADFYDARYFATKKGEVTRKYRRTVVRRPLEARDDGGAVVAHLAGPPPELVRVDRVLGPEAVAPRPLAAGAPRVALLRYAHGVPLRVHWDGNTLEVVPDRETLAAGGRELRAELARICGEGWARAHEGAVLYLTKYVTPHPHGEPHFFVKPWSFVRTPPGWSSLVEGISGEGHELLRGVVRTDGFHAVPAVFQVSATRPLRVRAGAPMLEVVPIPRELFGATFAARKVA